MKRRSFLKSATSAFPILLTQPFTLDAQSSGSPAKEAHVVPSGQDSSGETHAGFGGLRFKVPTQETRGNLLVIEHDNMVSGGPPLHLHLEQEEWFYVVEGEFLFQVGEERIRLKSGDSILGPRKVPHTFCAVGTTPGKMIIAFSPAGKMEQFFRDAANPLQDAAFYRKYDMELLGPPLKA